MKESIGVQKDCSPLDKDFHAQWSWRCKCGEYMDVLPFRWLARKKYNEHKRTCESHLTKREPDVCNVTVGVGIGE